MQPQEPIKPANDNISDPSMEPEKSAPPSLNMEHESKIIHPVSEDLSLKSPDFSSSQPNEAETAATQAPYTPQNTQSAAQNIQPVAPETDPLVGMTRSQLEQNRPRLPIGVYIIAGFALIGVIAGFFDTSQNSWVYTVAMLIDLFLAIGLLLRMEAARKAVVWLSGIILIITAVSLILLAAVQQRIRNIESDHQTVMSRIDQRKLTATQKKQLDDLQAKLSTYEKQAGKAIRFTYIKLGVTAVESIAVVIYLSRPRIRSAFRELAD